MRLVLFAGLVVVKNIMNIFKLVTTIILGFIFIGCNAFVIYANPQKSIYPAISHIGGIVVGKDTYNNLTKRYGKGAYMPGQHPTGGLSWVLKREQLVIEVDGFYVSHNGSYVIDSLTISTTIDKPHYIKSPSGEVNIGLFGKIMPGMKRDNINTYLKNTLSNINIIKNNKNEIVLSMAGKANFNHENKPRFMEWHALLKFEDDVLKTLTVFCD